MHFSQALSRAFAVGGTSVAVEDGAERITYRDLDRLSSDIAANLQAAGVGIGDAVCLLQAKGIRAIASILAALRIGAFYVPLDPGTPPARLSSMIRDCAPCWLLADRSLAEAAFECDGICAEAEQTKLLIVDDIARPYQSESSGMRSFEDVADDGLAYILFTSGSTGTPKGVPISRKSVFEYVSWANDHFGALSGDRIACQSPLHFDMSVWDIFGTLLAGATLVLVPRDAAILPETVAQFIRQSRVVQWYSVPSILVGLVERDVVKQNDFPDLRRVIWGGEAFPVPELRTWMTRVPHAQFTNVYGPTEATVNCTYFPVQHIPPADEKAVPIGFPIPGRLLAILDEDENPVPRGMPGQLLVGGIGLSPGYWHDPSKTAAAFTILGGERWYKTGDIAMEDESGVFHFRGRADRQIKSRGYRIELDDVACALHSLDSIAACAVVAVPVGGLEGMRICAAYVSATSVAASATEIKAALARLLPHYMVPRRWKALNALPINRNGKVDMPAITALFVNG